MTRTIIAVALGTLVIAGPAQAQTPQGQTLPRPPAAPGQTPAPQTELKVPVMFLPIVEAVRAEKDLWIVFAIGDTPSVAAANAGLDLSSEVVKRLDASMK